MKRILEILIGIFIGLIISGLLYLTVRAPTGEQVELLATPTAQPIFVYLTGAVKRPGVYMVPRESHLVEAVQLAGGFTDTAILDQINLADTLVDGSQVVIPGAEGIPTPQLTIGGDGLLMTATPPAGEPVNINTADVELLQELPGIGPTTAQAIIDYRTENGPFTRIDDLLKVPGIGPSVMDEIRSMVIVEP